MKISIIIKSYNEEENIANAIETSLSIVKTIGGGEIILADSLSNDRTIEIASKYPIKIVQLTNPDTRSCGIGAELGYRIAIGEYIYIMDADMVLEQGFLEVAIEELNTDIKLAGVSGIIREMNVDNAEFRSRSKESAGHLCAGEVDRLNGGGLFRKSAIDELDYLTNRNLHSFEEYELAVRLRKNGWHLKRLNTVSVKHYGHKDTNYSLLKKRWKGKYAWGGGELLREAFSNNYLYNVLRDITIFKKSIFVVIWWILIMMSFMSFLISIKAVYIVGALFIVPLLSIAINRKRTLLDSLYRFVNLNIYTLGIIIGLLSYVRNDPNGKIDMKIIK